MSSQDAEYTRIRFSDELGKYVDEHLEAVFSEVYYDSISTPEAIATLLDPYAVSVNGPDALPFGDALSNTEQAIRWSTQFGALTIKQLSEEEAREVKSDKDEPREIRFEAQIGRRGTHVFGLTVGQAAILAAVQSLREIADQVLNVQSNERPN